MLRSILINAELLMQFKEFCKKRQTKMKPALERIIKIYMEG